jgi:hypothetical protein
VVCPNPPSEPGLPVDHTNKEIKRKHIWTWCSQIVKIYIKITNSMHEQIFSMLFGLVFIVDIIFLFILHHFIQNLVGRLVGQLE